jgi:DNA-binding LytR/AlgR family response regulator
MKSLKILIVEDELITATSIQETLENAGHEITALARNLREALSAVKRQPPDLALIDITLENSTDDGIGVAKQLMVFHPMPIIYLTAHSEPSTILSAQETHPAAYLLKPFRHKELAIQVELAYYNYQINQETTIDPHAAESLYLPVEQGKGHVKIVKSEVLYLWAAGSYVEVHTIRDSKPFIFSMNLGYLAQFFKLSNYYRISRSLLINLAYVERIEKNQLFVAGRDMAITFPETQHKELLQKLAVVRTP